MTNIYTIKKHKKNTKKHTHTKTQKNTQKKHYNRISIKEIRNTQ